MDTIWRAIYQSWIEYAIKPKTPFDMLKMWRDPIPKEKLGFVFDPYEKLEPLFYRQLKRTEQISDN